MKAVNMIMVAVDFSEYTLPSVRYAARLAEDVGADLLLVNVINQRDVDMLKRIAAEAPNFSFESYLEEMRRDREVGFEKLIRDAGCREGAVKTRIRIGVPYEELLEVIASRKPDLLVMAIKGRSNLVGTIVGSCAQKMFRRSPIPVLSYRGEADQQR
jgi:nucleotide-binding universal stress UspA family protein